jgi:DNA-binding transcriptional LysR family regulator
MDLNALQAFVEVARSRSFSAAAESLYLTQPAVSKRIAVLEQQLEARLFDRIGRRISLTDAGEALLPRARRLLEEAEDMKRVLGNLSDEVHGTLSMATSHHIGLHRLPPVLRAYTRRFPEVQLDIRFMDSETACRAVQTGELQLAIVTLPPEETPTGLELETVWIDSLRFAVASEHPLAKVARPSVQHLTRHPAVLPSTNTYTRDILEREIRRHGATLKIGMTTNYLETLKMLVSIGLGWSLLPEKMLDPEIVVLPIPKIRPTRRLGLVSHADRTLSNAGRAMIETCRQFAEL